MATAVLNAAGRFGPRDAGRIMTLDEFDEAEYEEGYRYELLQGVLVVTPAPLEEERDANEELGYLLRDYQKHHPEGRVLDLTLPEHNIRTAKQNRKCDRALWIGLGRMPRTRGWHRRRDVPTVLVEFPSRGIADLRRDYEVKRIEYRDLGVREYWIIDRFRREMTVYFWRGSRWTKRIVQDGDIFTTPLLSGFELPLAKLLAISDRYPPLERFSSLDD